MEKDEIKVAQKLIDDECNEIVSSVPKNATELEKVQMCIRDSYCSRHPHTHCTVLLLPTARVQNRIL